MKNLIVPATDWRDVQREAEFQTLNSRGFVRGSSAEHQWFILVNEACSHAGVTADDLVREYLGTMLCRFMTRSELFEQFGAFSFYEHMLGARSIDGLCVQDAADISLQYVAFFPERTLNRHEPRSLEHIAYIGTNLYRELARKSEGKDDWFSQAWQAMASSFEKSVMILRAALPDFSAHSARWASLWQHDALLFLHGEDAARIGKEADSFGKMYLQKAENPSALLE